MILFLEFYELYRYTIAASFKFTDIIITNDTVYNILTIRIVTYFDICT